MFKFISSIQILKNNLLQLVTTIFITLSLSQNLVANPDGLLTLKAALKEALEKNPAQLKQNEKINELQSQVGQTRSLILPTITATGNAQYLKDSVNMGSARFGGEGFNLYKLNIKLSQPLFQFGSFEAIESVKKDVEIQKKSDEISARDLSKNVILSYYNVVLNSFSLNILIKQRRIVEESLATTIRREQSGRGQRIDVLQVKTEIALLDSQIENAKNNFEIAIATLQSLAGNAQWTSLNIKPILPSPALTEVYSLVDESQLNLPELTKNNLSLLKVENQRNVIWGQHLPQLSFTGDLTYTNYSKSDLLDEMSKSYAFGLQLTIPLFSGFSSIYQRQALSSQYLQFELEKANLINQFTLLQISSKKSLESAKKSVENGEKAFQLAQQTLEEANRKYNLGTIDFLQFLQVEKSYIQAQFSLYTYKYNYISNLTNYFINWGQDLSKLTELLDR